MEGRTGAKSIKHNVGDAVTVVNSISGGIMVAGMVDKFGGKQVTINSIQKYNNTGESFYRIKEDDSCWWWDDMCFDDRIVTKMVHDILLGRTI